MTYDSHMEGEGEDIISSFLKDKRVIGGKEKFFLEYKQIIESYHRTCSKMNRVQVLDMQRVDLMIERISEYGINKVLDNIERAGKSEFLNGINDKSWHADFDWILNQQNFIKILEGKYDKKPVAIKLQM